MADIDYKIANKDETDMTAQTLATHQAESASKHITESGSNSNGEYIRYDDGTQICWKDFLMTSTGFQETWTFPKPFNPAWNNRRTSNKNIFGTTKVSGTFDGAGESLLAYPTVVRQVFSTNSNNSATIVVHVDTLGEGRQIDIVAVAIGRWK